VCPRQAQHLLQHTEQSLPGGVIQRPFSSLVAGGAVYDLARQQGTDSRNRLHQPAEQRPRLGIERPSQRGTIELVGGQLVLRRGRHIGLAGQHGAVTIDARRDPPRTLEDNTLRTDEDQIAQPAHDLTDKVDRALWPTKAKTKNAFESGLRDAAEPRAFDILAQEELQWRYRWHASAGALGHKCDAAFRLGAQEQLMPLAGIDLKA